MFNTNKIRDPITPTYWLKDQSDASEFFIQSGTPVNIITRTATVTGSVFPIVFNDLGNVTYRFVSSTIGDALATNASPGTVPASGGLSAINVFVNFAEGSTVFATVSCFYQGDTTLGNIPTLFDHQALFVYYSAQKQKYYFGQFPLENTFTTTTGQSISGSTTIQLSSLYSNSQGSFGEFLRLRNLGYI